MNNIKILKIILLCLIIATLVVGVLLVIKYWSIYKSDREVKDAMSSICEQYESINGNIPGATIEAEYKGHKVVRNDRNT